MTDLRQAAQQALDNICSAKLCEINNMSSRHEMVRLMDEAIAALEAALAASSNIEAVSSPDGQAQKMDVPQPEPFDLNDWIKLQNSKPSGMP